MEPVYIEPVESERKYQRLAELGTRLKIPVTEAFLTLKVLDRNGRVNHHTKQRSHSWTRNAYQMLATGIGGMRNSGTFADGSLATRNTAGSVISNVYLANTGGVSSNFNVDSEAVGKAYRGPNGDNVSGVVVGTGDTPESFNDYALAAALAEGTGAGQVNYMAGEPVVKSWDAGTRTLSVEHKRYINNNSPGTITIREIGLIANGSQGTSLRALMSRDVLGTPVDVPASGQILAIYTIALIYPS